MLERPYPLKEKYNKKINTYCSTRVFSRGARQHDYSRPFINKANIFFADRKFATKFLPANVKASTQRHLVTQRNVQFVRYFFEPFETDYSRRLAQMVLGAILFVFENWKIALRCQIAFGVFCFNSEKFCAC